ncbi:MAG: hypothetical protein KJ064_21265 [Anaerolineae bacterium]|nr:hypothetical protein [Anaerolineae bacterium]
MAKKKNLLGILARIGLMLGGVICALVTGLLAADRLDLLPSDDPLDQRIPNRIMEVRYTETHGDLFYHLPGEVKPPENPALLSAHTVTWDENGFRVPAMRRDSYAEYPIVALGDSFTDAWMVEFPWVDVLARELNTPVLNLSYQGYGPVEEAAVLQEYGTGDHAWVLVGFFEGNDLQNIRTSLEHEDENPLVGLVREAVEPDPKIVLSADGNYPYPLALYIGSDYYELAFYDFYLWILNGERETYAASKNLAELRTYLEKIAESSGDACVGLVYMPDKGHIYFPYAEPYGRRWILDHSFAVTLGEDQWLDTVESGAADFEAYVARLDNQRDAVQALVEEMGLYFIDLTPAFQQRAAESHMLYFTYDTHWNPDGHELAGQTVAKFVENVPECQ